MHRPSLSLLVPLCCLAALPGQTREVVDQYLDGNVRARYQVDADGRRHGVYKRYFRSGRLRSASRYRLGKRHGRHEEFDQKGELRLRCHYADGLLHGTWEAFDAAGEPGARHEYEAGRKLAPATTLLPPRVPRDELRRFLARQRPTRPGPTAVAKDPLLRERLEAAHRVRIYRFLAGLGSEPLRLDSTWHAHCDLAMRLCAREGRVTHEPKRPTEMPEETYERGLMAAQQSNISARGHLTRAVDQFMFDSDPTNIKDLGHRRNCLNPLLRSTAFGRHQAYGAMWIGHVHLERSGGPNRVLYPPPGFLPVEFFDPEQAWSISTFKGQPAQQGARVSVYPLHAKTGLRLRPLRIVAQHLSTRRFGDTNTLIFLPAGMRVAPGLRYLCEVDLDGDGDVDLRYRVELVP